MHMADALVSPVVGGVAWVTAAAVGGRCAAKVRSRIDEGSLPLMGVAGAFVFAAQMINFSIPGTGSSGHIGGGVLLAALLGPHAAFLAIASVLTIQALFFADGGLLALGCNLVNLGLFPAFVAYPLIFRPIAGEAPGRARLTAATIAAAVVALQLGAFAVVLETTASGISQLPFGAFVALMQPIHLAIGVVEGLATAAVLLTVREARPEILSMAAGRGGLAGASVRGVVVALLIAAVLLGGGLSWVASTHPDGLEWSLAGVTGSGELDRPDTGAHRELARVQERLAVFPDYELPADEGQATPAPSSSAGPSVGGAVPGVVGSAVTLAVLVLVAVVLRRRTKRPG